MKTVREELEQAIPALQQFASDMDNRAVDGKGYTPDDVEELKRRTEHVNSLIEGVKAAAAAAGAKGLGEALLTQLSGTGDAPHADPNAALAAATGIIDPKGMTLGEAFAKSPAYQEFVKSFRGPDGSIRNVPISKAAEITVNSGLYVPRGKALVTGLSDTSAGAFVTTERIPQIGNLIPDRRLTIRDLCTNIDITSDTFDFVQVTGKTNNAAGTLEPTTSATPGLNNVAVGAYTAAHGVKPESALTFAVVSSIVETIAHWIPVTRRAAADGGQVRSLIDAFLLYGLAEEEEDQILNGNGTTPNLRGILNTVGINTVGSAGTDIDAIVDAIAAIRTDGYEATGLVIHPDDWFSTGFLLAKDSAGNYLIANPSAPVDQQQSLWGLRVVVTPAMTANTALVGAFRMAVVADRQQSAIYVSDSHNDFFVRNILAILAEERLGFGVLDPEAFCTVTAV